MIHKTMGPTLTAFCERVGRLRHEDSVLKRRQPKNNASTDPDVGLAGDILGALCEGIAWSWLKPILWNYPPDRSGLPDLVANNLKINVKGIDKPHHSLLVLQDANPNWAYLLVLRRHPEYDILGWLWGHEAKQQPVKELQPRRPCHVTKQNALIRPEALFRLVRMAKEKGAAGNGE